MTASLTRVWLPKGVVWLACGAPLAWLAYAIVQEAGAPGSVLGADPGKEVVQFLGRWGIRMLLAALAISPLRRWLRWPDIARVRRLVGLFAFTYLSLHLLAYLWFLAGFDWSAILKDLSERTYIAAGFLGWLCLVPLAITSTRGWQRRLRRRWVLVHRLVFATAGLGLVHLWWLTKDGYGEVILYAVIFLVLMGERVSRWRQSHGKPGQTVLRSVQRELSGGSGV